MRIWICEDVGLKTTQTSPVPRFIFRFALENLCCKRNNPVTSYNKKASNWTKRFLEITTNTAGIICSSSFCCSVTLPKFCLNPSLLSQTDWTKLLLKGYAQPYYNKLKVNHVKVERRTAVMKVKVKPKVSTYMYLLWLSKVFELVN